MNAPPLRGLHHVTAISGDAQENLDFYTGVMGLRLVKKSINQDSPDTYHLFYADADGSPGTDLTFFPWSDAPPATPGAGKITEVALAIPGGTLPYWRARLTDHDVDAAPEETRFGHPALPFTDPHGLQVALVEITEERSFVPWDASPVPADRQVIGLHGVRLWERQLEPTEALLTRVMGFTKQGTEGDWYRFSDGDGGSGTIVDVRVVSDRSAGRWGPGGIHHAAWRMADDDEQEQLRALVDRMGLRPSPQIDRFWFRSVYFREPGGALFELATDGPGFTRDEDRDTLGEKLILPPWMEEKRQQIEAGLPDLTESVAS